MNEILDLDDNQCQEIKPEEVLPQFRECFFEILRKKRGEYVRDVVGKHVLSQRLVAEILGYGPNSSGAIVGAMEGKISDQKFALLQATVADEVVDPPSWPTPTEFATLAFLAVMTHFGKAPFKHEEYEILNRVLRVQWILNACEQSSFGSFERSLESMLNEIHRITRTNRIKTVADVGSVIECWGRLFRFCRSQIPGQRDK